MAENNKMIITALKETFIVRVLLNKAVVAGADCEFVPCNVNDINAKLHDDILIVLYMDEGDRPKDEVTHFITDSLSEKGGQVIVIGEQEDMDYMCDRISGELIYAKFARPVDNAKFSDTIADYFKKVNSGEFKKSILVVDDDPNFLSLIRQWLKDSYKVFVVGSGLQDIKFLGKNKVDLILLDHEMPVTTGPQVLEMLRSDEETKSIPVMFLTGKSDKESVMAVVALKPEGYFLKTIQREELLQKLQEFFVLHK
jgi:CheY-like chemotaxis protein